MESPIAALLVGAAKSQVDGLPGTIAGQQSQAAPTLLNQVMAAPPVVTITGAASFTGSIAANVLTVTAMTYGGIVAGQVLAGAGVGGSPTVAAFGTGGTTGTGGAGTYQLSASFTIGSQAFTAVGGYTATTIASSARVVALSTAFKMTGTPTIAWNIDASYQVPTQGAGTQSVGKYVVWEWWSDAKIIEILLNNFGSNFDLWVDDHLVQPAAFSNPIGTGQRFQLKLDWTADVEPNKPRYYRLAGMNLPFGGLYLSGEGSAWFPVDRAHRKLLVAFGDSYLVGVGAASVARSVGAFMAAQLGYDYWADGLSGSTWNTASPNDALTREQNGIKVLARDPDVIVAPFGYNSNATPDLTPMAAAMDAWLAAVEVDQPQAKIVIFGPWTPLGTTAGTSAVKAVTSARAAAADVPFVDIEAWVNAANKATYVGVDNVHPTPAGHAYLGRRMALPLAPLLAP